MPEEQDNQNLENQDILDEEAEARRKFLKTITAGTTGAAIAPAVAMLMSAASTSANATPYTYGGGGCGCGGCSIL